MSLPNKLFSFLLFSVFSISSSSVAVQQVPNKWKTDMWGTCHSPKDCGEGLKKRTAYCTSSVRREILLEDDCDASVKPRTERNCFKVCQGHKHLLRWSVGPWRECLPTDPSLPCKNDQLGEATREVRCLLNSTEDGLEKVVSDSACKFFWTQPHANQICSLECPQDCIVVGDGEQNSDDWEPKLESSEVILVAPSLRGRPCFRRKSLCMNGQQCVIDRNPGYILKVHEWSPCLPIEENNHPYHFSFSMLPTLGRTTRNITCLNNQTGEMVDLRLCDAVEQHVEQLCVVSSDCEASPWSEWKVDREGCRNSQGITTPEIRSRVRDLVKGAVSGGALCGPLFEQRVIVMNLPPCEKYKWRESEWGDCVFYTHYKINKVKKIIPKCGGGVQVRNLTCVRVLDTMPVSDSMCLDPRPPHVQVCSVSCIRDCKVSRWSKWGPCLPFSDGLEYLSVFRNGVRTRKRTILIKASDHGEDCPHLIEQIICNTDDGLYDLRYGEWSDCRPRNSKTQCGMGERTRDFTCLANGNLEKELFCQNLMKDNRGIPETSEKCHIPCPSDCVLSEWSKWTICSEDASGINKTTSNRTVLAIGDHTDNPCHHRRLKRERQCAEESPLKLIYWKMKPWGQCIPQNGSCGQGTRKRKIVCNTGLVYNRAYSCEDIPKPAEKQDCFLPCPVDCDVTAFSDWSTCSSPCSIEIQGRDRFILTINKYGGTPCPAPLRETRLCCFNETACLSYALESESEVFQWKLSNWTNCILPIMNHRCGTGFQIRNVSCVNTDKKAVEMHWCTRSSTSKPKNLSELVELMPAHFRLCHVMCPPNKPPCILSGWSSWTECSHHYFQATRFRTREFIGKSTERTDCQERYALREEEICPRLESRSVLSGSLGSCIIDNRNRTSVAVNSQISLLSCGVGYKFRSGLQMSGLDAVEQGVEKDLCIEDCPIDCLMSKWSTWTKCNVTCGQGYRTNYRKVLQQPNAYGRPCPPKLDGLIDRQTEVCEVPCRDYSWVAYGWGNCTLIHSKNSIRGCGKGEHRRSVRCMEIEQESFVNDKYCDSASKPISKGACKIHCPGECVMSEWEVWKPCFNPCRPNDKLEKRRRILRASNPEHLPCPIEDLVKREDCILNSTCFTFSWKLGMWSSCVLPEGALCGEGTQRKARVCERSDGRHVNGVHCEKKEGLQKNAIENLLFSEPCFVDCPIDCVVSEWSNWNSTNCGECRRADMTRSRKILQPPSDAGQPCPKLEQRKPCPFKPCYHWYSNWSDCDLMGMTCGTGIRRRLVRCLRYDGLQVDKLHCLVTNITFPIKDWLDPNWLVQGHNKAEEEKCYVQCPGDCILSEWSDWSHCHKDCDKGQTIGYRTSSRFIIALKSISTGLCSDVLVRTMPCWDTKCYSFGWKYRNNTLQCERSDKLIVKGGCTNTRLPCHPDCKTVFRGNCDPKTGDCFCEFLNGERKLIALELGNVKQVCNSTLAEGNQSPIQPANHTAPTQMTTLKYYPDDRETSIWMYAMISIGTAFIIFVVVTIYLMCRSSIHRRMASVHRQASVRRRELNNQEKNTGVSTAVFNKSYE